jgi:hypothetical protein
MSADELNSTPYQELASGTQKHFTRDQLFHSSQFFQQSESNLNAIFKPIFESQNIARYWFASHIFSEMMIDRVLMKKHPEMLDQFYFDLTATQIDEITAFISSRGIEDIGTFSSRISRFNESQFLRQYVHNPALIYSLNRVFIYAKAGEEWTPDQYQELQKPIAEIEAWFEENLDQLISEMK